MAYRIESIEVFVRETPPGRMAFVLGKQKPGTGSKPETPPPAAKRRPRGILVCRMVVSDDQGRSAWGASGDRPSFGWLDKRSQYNSDEKLERLLKLVEGARRTWLDNPSFASPFEQWLRCHTEIQKQGGAADHEALTASYASALFERAMIDAVCRLHNRPVFEMLKGERLGIDPGRLHSQLKGMRLSSVLPPRPRTEIAIRHTVGLADPILAEDQPADKRIDDGEPETLEEYIARDGLRYFKVKISGDADADLDRLGRIWDAVVKADMPVVTLDGNESSHDIDAFARFVEDFERRIPGLFQHTAFIEQPLTRALTHDPSTSQTIRQISKKKRLVIDEADGTLESFSRAFRIGYDGVSHKNCKGFLKSLLNRVLCRHFIEATGREAFQTGEDLSLMPLVPIQQDFAALGILDIDNCERNGHHYSYGQGHLTDREKALMLEHHPELYVRRTDEVFLDIRDGKVRCDSLQCPGFGVRFEPEWKAMEPLGKWTAVW